MHPRLRQGLRALRAWVRPPDRSRAAPYLSPPLFSVFEMMRAGEAQHSLNVLDTLRARGESDPALLAAALLHDCGKAQQPYWLWERALIVIARKLFPSRLERWGGGEPRGWRRPFVVNRQHPVWGAALVTTAGADPLTIELIANHARKLDHAPRDEYERLLAALQAADDEN